MIFFIKVKYYNIDYYMYYRCSQVRSDEKYSYNLDFIILLIDKEQCELYVAFMTTIIFFLFFKYTFDRPTMCKVFGKFRSISKNRITENLLYFYHTLFFGERCICIIKKCQRS